MGLPRARTQVIYVDLGAGESPHTDCCPPDPATLLMRGPSVGSARIWMTLEPLLRNEPYRGTSLIRNNPRLGPYSRTMSRAHGGPRGGAVSYERGNFALRTHQLSAIPHTPAPD